MMRRWFYPFLAAIALALIAGATALAFDVRLEGEMRLRYQTPSNGNRNDVPLVPMDFADTRLELRLRGSGSLWNFNMDNVLRAENIQNISFQSSPPYRVQIRTSSNTFDLWGNGWNLGGDAARMDPVGLVVLGNQGMVEYVTRGGPGAGTASGQHRVRTAFAPGGIDVTVDYHRLAAAQNNIEVHAESAFGSYTLGAVGRQHLFANAENNSAMAVGYAKTELAGATIGGSVGINLGKTSDNLAFGVSAETDVDFADGKVHLFGAFINRGENFHATPSQDAAWQDDRFGGDGEAGIIDVAATYRTEGDVNRATHSIINPTNASTLKGLVLQGAGRYVNKDNPRTIVVGRVGAPLIPHAWVALEVSQTRDEDGVGSIGGKAGMVQRNDIVGSVRYQMGHLGLTDWTTRFRIEHRSGKDLADNPASQIDYRVEVYYDSSGVETLFGYRVEGRDAWDYPNTRLYGQFRVKF